MKCYRYLIYKLYSWGLIKGNDTPVFNVIITLTFINFVHLFTLYLIVLKFVPRISIFNLESKVYLYLFGLLFILLNYFLLYNKKRWEAYMKEFENEEERESKKGTFYVLCYLIGSIVLFFISLPILFG
jgi:hypothetical protein